MSDVFAHLDDVVTRLAVARDQLLADELAVDRAARLAVVFAAEAEAWSQLFELTSLRLVCGRRWPRRPGHERTPRGGRDAPRRTGPAGCRSVVERGLADRVVLRRQDAAALTVVAAFDLAYLPAYFVLEDAVVAALPRIWAALRPGGWIFVPVREGSGSELARAVTRWQHPGCAVWSPQETEHRLVEAGFDDVHSIVVSPLAPTIVVGAHRAGPGGR